MMNSDDQKWKIPEKYRVSLDMTDEAAFALLQKCDEQQKEWSKTFNTPLSLGSPLEKARAKAVIEIEAMSNLASVRAFTDEEAEIFAEHCAVIGRYDLAAFHSTTQKDEYEKIWQALFLPDDEWCEHVAKHKFVRANIFSVKHGKEMPLLACNICGTYNVADLPEEIEAARAKRSTVREAAAGQRFGSIQEALDWHRSAVNKR